jgi:hypothetical protein
MFEPIGVPAALGSGVFMGWLITVALTATYGSDLSGQSSLADHVTSTPIARAGLPFVANTCDSAPREATASDGITFSGYDWIVRPSGMGGPGPNQWDERNVWVDDRGELHLKLAARDGKWYCSEIHTRKPLGFGRYQFWVVGRLDELDPNVVFGLFNYPTRDVGPDGTHEIDIEFAQWGKKSAAAGNYTVWPARKGLKQTSNVFAFILNGDYSTHRFVWSSTSVDFQSLHGHEDDDHNQYSRWQFKPSDPVSSISQKPMPLHINLWCFKGRPPTDGKPVELVVRSFTFTPE